MTKTNIPPYRRLLRKGMYLTSRLWGDKLFLKLYFYANIGKWPDFDNPKTFNEKINWLKINNKHSEYSMLVDKCEVKKYVASLIGEEYIIPTLAVYDTVEEIDFEMLPSQFVLKCTHDSGGIVVCKDKKGLDQYTAKRKLNKALSRNFVSITREYPYKGVNPRIIVERYMEDEFGELRDYKFLCSNGKVWMLFIGSNRQSGMANFDFYTPNFEHLPILNGHPMAPYSIEKPQGFEKMIEIASKLSEGFQHVRVDLYNINGKIYFGEYTFFHNSGLVPITPSEFDIKMGDNIIL